MCLKQLNLDITGKIFSKQFLFEKTVGRQAAAICRFMFLCHRFSHNFFVILCFVVEQVSEYRMTEIACVLNQLAVSKQCWEAADTSIYFTCTAKLLKVTQGTPLSTVLDLLTKILGGSTRIQTQQAFSRDNKH